MTTITLFNITYSLRRQMGMALFSVLSIENLRALGDPPQDILTSSGHTLLRSCEVMACLSSHS